jgi:HK97 family phage portal protein
MAISDIFKSREKRLLQSELARMVTGYQPTFYTYSGGVYEMDLTVSAIDSFARHASKANPKVKGAAYGDRGKHWEVYANDTMTMSQFLYRVATIYECEHNVFIVPVKDNYTNFVRGFYPVSSSGAKITLVNGVLMLSYRIGQKEYAIPYAEVAHLKSHQYKDEFFGHNNASIGTTLQLLDTQNQGIINGIKQSAIIRFIAKASAVLKEDDINKAQALLNKGLSVENQNGVLVFDGKFSELQQVKSNPYVVDALQSEFIRKNVYNYFGTNEKILQNNFNETEWAAYYEGKVEPFLIQLSQALTRLLFTDKEIAVGNYLLFESVRLQHADIKTKWAVASGAVDRGMMTINEARLILNLPEIDGGDVRMIRKDFTNADAQESEEDDDNEGQTV